MHSQPYVKHTHVAFPPHPCPHPRTLTQTPRTALRPFGNPHHLSRAPTSALPIWATKTHKLRPHRVTTCCVLIVITYSTSLSLLPTLYSRSTHKCRIPSHHISPSSSTLCNTKKRGLPLTAAAYLILPPPKLAPKKGTCGGARSQHAGPGPATLALAGAGTSALAGHGWKRDQGPPRRRKKGACWERGEGRLHSSCCPWIWAVGLGGL